MTNPNNNNLWKYAGLGGQFIAGIALFLFGGIKLDEWLKTSSPMATWILPLVYITAIIIKIVIETGKKK